RHRAAGHAPPGAGPEPACPRPHPRDPSRRGQASRRRRGGVDGRGSPRASRCLGAAARSRAARATLSPSRPRRRARAPCGRGVLASPDATTGVLTVWASTQVPFAVRSGIADALGLPEERIRVIVPEVGGGFGVKGHAYPEDILVPAVARRLGRPVKWTETRREHFLASAADRAQAHEARIGVKRDGTIVALETSFTRDHGAFPTLGEAITQNTTNHLPGPYRIPHYRGAGRNIVTHKTFAAAYRGAGRPEAALVLDRLLDRAARRLGL